MSLLQVPAATTYVECLSFLVTMPTAMGANKQDLDNSELEIKAEPTPLNFFIHSLPTEV